MTTSQTPGFSRDEMSRRTRWKCWLHGPFHHDFKPYVRDPQILVCIRCHYGFWFQQPPLFGGGC